MRVVVVDDHPVVRNGLVQTLSGEEQIEVVGEASGVDEGLQVISAARPDVAIVDLKMPDGDGIELIRAARSSVPRCSFIVLTAYGAPPETRRAVEEKVEGYVLKEATPEELLWAVRLVHCGRRYYSPDVMDSLLEDPADDGLFALTEREREVLAAVAKGLDNRAIGEHLHISEHTVRKHVSNIISKLPVKNRVEIAHYAISRGIIGAGVR